MRELWAAWRVGVALMLCPVTVWSQERQGDPSDSLPASLRLISARLDSLEAGLCPSPLPLAPGPTGDTRSDTLAAELRRLTLRLELARDSRCAAGAPAAAQARDTTDELAGLRAAAAAAAAAAAPRDVKVGDSVPGARPAPSPGGNANLLNPEISATGDIRLVARHESPPRDNGVAREFEFSFQSALDPYSKTKIFLTFEDDVFGVEEGYVYWSGLPGRIRADLGLFRQPIGDLNRWHLHALPEGEYPLVYQRFLGEEGLSGVGVSLYTALPLSIGKGTHEVTLQATTAASEPLYAGGRQPTLLGRLQNFWQLSRTTYAQLGLTATGGNNSDADLRSRLVGLDFRLTYRPPEAATRRDITFRAEGYRLHAAELEAVTNRYGVFLDLQARTSRRWILGARYDWVEAPRGPEDTEWRITPAITWWQSEFVYLRLQGEHRHSETAGGRNQVSLQAVWAMGPHKHETY
jgi:hypothetical protein